MLDAAFDQAQMTVASNQDNDDEVEIIEREGEARPVTGERNLSSEESIVEPEAEAELPEDIRDLCADTSEAVPVEVDANGAERRSAFVLGGDEQKQNCREMLPKQRLRWSLL